MKCAGRFDRLKDGDHVARSDAKAVQAINQFLQADAAFKNAKLVVLAFIHLDIGSVDGFGRAGLREGEKAEKLAEFQLRGWSGCPAR